MQEKRYSSLVVVLCSLLRACPALACRALACPAFLRMRCVSCACGVHHAHLLNTNVMYDRVSLSLGGLANRRCAHFLSFLTSRSFPLRHSFIHYHINNPHTFLIPSSSILFQFIFFKKMRGFGEAAGTRYCSFFCSPFLYPYHLNIYPYPLQSRDLVQALTSINRY